MNWTRRSFLAALSAAALIPKSLASPARLFTPIRRGVGTFAGRGGTIGWLLRNDAAVAVDSQFPDTAAQFLTGVNERQAGGLDLLINSHHHGDHTAGNAVLAPAAARVVAHQNVPGLQRAAATRSDALDRQAYADVTFDETWEAAVGDEIVSLHHFGPAHTAGDAIIHFQHADVAHMGDLVFNRMPCFIDIDGGASTAGWIDVLEKTHDRFTDDTMFIFGHGNPAYGITGTREDLLVMRDFLTAMRAHVSEGLASGSSLDTLTDLTTLPGFPEHYAESWSDGIPNAIRAVYRELSSSE